MSILSAIRQQSSSIDDLAKLPQAMIMQMAQRKQIAAEMVAPILARKAEIIDAAVKTRAMQQGAPQASVMEQILAKNAQLEQPMIRENTGIAQIPVPEPQYAGGGIIAFDEGGDVDEEDDDTSYEDYLDELERYKLESLIHRTYDNDSGAPSVGIGYVEAASKRGGEKAKEEKPSKKGIEDLTAYVLQKESGGRRYDKAGNLLTSPKGAEGEMQVMPYTSRDPGFGVTPARDRSPDEIARVGREYLSAMLNRYGDPKLAAIAYNMGPGATDKWLAAGADVKKLPEETRGYIRGLAGGGAIAFANRGLVDDFGNLIDEEEKKLKEKPMSKEAQRAMAEKTAREAKIKGAGPVKPTTTGIGGLRGATLPALGISAATAAYEGLSGPDQVNIPTAADTDRGDLTAEQIAAAKRPALIYPRIRGRERYTSELPVTREQAPRPITASPLTTAPAATMAAGMPPNYTPDESGSPYMDGTPPMTSSAAPAPAAETPVMSAEDKMFAQMQDALAKRETRLEQSRQMDPYLALLSAGLGMISSKSPYGLVGIGEGGGQGVSQFAALQRARAAEEAGLGTLQEKMLRTSILREHDRNKLEQAKTGKEATLAQNLQVAKNNFIKERLGKLGIDEIMLGNLKRKEVLGKLSGDDAKLLEFYERQRRTIESEANRLYASPGAGMKVVGVRG